MDTPLIQPGDTVMLQLSHRYEDPWEEVKLDLEAASPGVQFWALFNDVETAQVLWVYRTTPVQVVLAASGPDHPERTCARCDGPNITWSAPSPLWNEVMRGGDINGAEIHSGVVCPTCFAICAEERGIAQLWRLTAERVHVPLQAVTPTGRVWNDQTWLWDDAPAASGEIVI